MQVNSVTSYGLTPSRVLMANRVANKPVQEQEPAQGSQEPIKSIYFTGDDSGNSMKKATMGVLLPLTLLSAGVGVTSCDKDVYSETNLDVDATATATATATANANASAIIKGDGCYHGGHCHKTDTIVLPGDTVYLPGDTIKLPGDTIILPGEPGDTVYLPGDTVYRDRLDTLYITKWDTCYIDTGSYHHDVDTIIKWKERYDRPLPLDTLTKHMVIFDVDDADSVKNRNIIHYEYTRDWEYNNRVIANMNVLESNMNKNILVHDVEVKDYKKNHLYYGKEVRRIPSAPVTLTNKDGSQVRTKAGIFLEMYKNPNDQEGTSIFDSELQTRYFLQTAGKKVKVYKYTGNNEYIEKGTITKGFLGKNSILLNNLIGDYDTEDHLKDVKVVGVTDDTLKEMYVRARDEQDKGASVSTTRADRRNDDAEDPNALSRTYVSPAWRYE